MKGYRTGANPAYLEIRNNGNVLSWPGVSLPGNATNESWIEQIVTIPAGGSLQVGVAWTTVTNGESFFVNEIEIDQLTTVTPEYQYNLKDHLGNVRVSFTTAAQTTTNYTATFETGTQTTEQATPRRCWCCAEPGTPYAFVGVVRGAGGRLCRCSSPASVRTDLINHAVQFS